MSERSGALTPTILRMRFQIATNCPGGCGVRLVGEVETDSREFFYRFVVWSGGDLALAATEIEGQNLATFAPDSKDWFVACPRCATPIRVDAVIPSGA